MRSDAKKVTVIPALEKALDILEFLASEGKPMTVREIAQALNIATVTAYRTVNYLCSRNYLSEKRGSYTLGDQIAHLARQLSHQTDWVKEAAPVLRRLALQSEQTAQLGILSGFGVTYIDQRMPPHPVSIIAALRTILPINVSASGKVLVANLPSEEREYFLQHAELPAQTENTLTDLDEFRAELDRVREQGYALDFEEYARGIGCVAAPIRDANGHAVAAVGITGHIADYLDTEHLTRLIGYVQQAAQEISAQIQARGAAFTL
jgi:DNA-binding IclR family transcriptional regulator